MEPAEPGYDSSMYITSDKLTSCGITELAEHHLAISCLSKSSCRKGRRQLC
jgi:hypothetical protein